MKTIAFQLASGILLCSLFSACGGDKDHPVYYEEDTHSRGKAMLYIEEGYKPLFETSIYTFESQYPKADVSAKYCSENNAILAFFKDSTKAICISRDFSKEEREALKAIDVEYRSTKIAEDAVALIVNPENPDTTLTVEQLKALLTGKDTAWNQLDKKGDAKRVNLVFDQNGSGNFRYLRELVGNKSFPANVFAVNSNKEVIDYVANNKQALGVISVNWISDDKDEKVLGFLSKVKVMGIAKDTATGYFQPYQAYIQTKDYPLTREVWIINKGRKSGLFTGFELFMSGEKGQLIILKSGLVPAVSPVRVVEINTQPLDEYMNK